jgi:hypothetical protein
MGFTRNFRSLAPGGWLLAAAAWSVGGKITDDSCPVKARTSDGKWQNYSGHFSSGTKINGKKVGSTVLFQTLGGVKGIYAIAARCAELGVGSASTKTPRGGLNPSSSYFTISGAPQYITTTFTVLNSSSERVTVKGTILGAAGALGFIIPFSNFQLGLMVELGFGTGSANSTAGEYEAKYARGFYVLAPIELYYSFGSSALGVSGGLQYLSLNWPVEAGNPDVTEPDTRFSYVADFGYRFMGDGYFINPRVGLFGGGTLFAELRGGVAF